MHAFSAVRHGACTMHILIEYSMHQCNIRTHYAEKLNCLHFSEMQALSPKLGVKTRICPTFWDDIFRVWGSRISRKRKRISENSLQSRTQVGQV